MFIELLMVLAGILSSISSTRVPPLEQVMRDTLKQVMRCPQWTTDQDIGQPVAAFSVARYMQLVALVRKDSEENSCGRRSQLPFHLNNPRSWNFCAMGICSEDQSCSCFKDFVGEKCNKFQGRCWLFYCRLVGCNKEAPTLHCSCSPSLYGSPVARGIYFYDHGFEQNYIPPPFGYSTTAFVDSHLIRQTGPGQFEIIGGNYYQDTKTARSYAEKKYSNNILKPKYMYPEQDLNKQNFYRRNLYSSSPFSPGFRREIYSQDLEPVMHAEIPDSYRKKKHIDYQYPKQKRLYYSKPYKWNEEDVDRENNNDILQTSRPVLEYGDAVGLHTYPGNILSNFAPRRTHRTERIGGRMQMRSYSGSADRVMFHYPDKDGDNKFQHKWQENERSASYLPGKTVGNYDHNSNNHFLRNYPDFRYNKKLTNRDENGEILYNPDEFRMRRQQGIEPLEQSTIKETWADDEEESDEDENFKFVSAAQTNRFSPFNTFLLSTCIFISLHFLE